MTLRRLFGAIALSLCACYSAGDGTAPPDKNFYFPVGLAVSSGGNVLYVVNSDFDLQWSGGTLQSYDLHLIRKHAVLGLQTPPDPKNELPYLRPRPTPDQCPTNPPAYRSDGTGTGQPLGETCSPPVSSQFYVRDSAILGAFATDLQLWGSATCRASKTSPCAGARLFTPVRGDASLTWADIEPDDPEVKPDEDPKTSYRPFALDCGTRVANRCDAAHHAGNDPNELGNTRHVTMPGEPFGMAQSEDGTAIVITHQSDTKASLFSTGISAAGARTSAPSLQFVADGLALGGNGIAAVPHPRPCSTTDAEPCSPPPCPTDPSGGPCLPPPPRPAFLLTSRSTAEIDLLRYYSDSGVTSQSSLLRPFVLKEAAFPLTVNAGGTDSRGIVIDPTPRLACKAAVRPADPTATPPRSDADVDADNVACARLPARVFIANRTPASLILGEIGEPSLAGDSGYDTDRLVLFGNTPLSVGPSRLYLAPIVDADGTYALRVFIVCFDSATIFVYDPDAQRVENIIHVGAGPYALAFDPFSIDDVAAKKLVPPDPREPGLDLKAYRFAYVASFTNSFVQVIDLDNSRPDKSSFERVVLTLGSPTAPKGSQ